MKVALVWFIMNGKINAFCCGTASHLLSQGACVTVYQSFAHPARPRPVLYTDGVIFVLYKLPPTSLDSRWPGCTRGSGSWSTRERVAFCSAFCVR